MSIRLYPAKPSVSCGRTRIDTPTFMLAALIFGMLWMSQRPPMPTDTLSPSRVAMAREWAHCPTFPAP